MFKILMILPLLVLASCGDFTADRLKLCEGKLIDMEYERNKISWELANANISLRESGYKNFRAEIEGCEKFRNKLVTNKEKLSDDSWKFCESLNRMKL